MNNIFPFIQNWMQKNNMTPDEKRQMKTSIVSYMSQHPVKSHLLNPYSLRYFAAAFSALVLVLGGSVGISYASQSALPNQTLYPVKIWIEEYKSSQAKTPADKIAFETTRIQTRFAEASQLAIKHQLDTNNSATIQAGIEHSELAINASADSVSTTNPELALAATTNVEAELSSNSKILAAIGQNTNQNLQTFILGTQITTQKVTLAKTNYEQIVSMTPNTTSKSTATTLLAKIKIEAPTPATESGSTTNLPVTAAVTTKATASVTAIESATAVTTAPSVSDLVTSAQKQMNQGSYSDAVITLQKAQQIIDEASLTQNLEKTYQVTTTADTNASATDVTTTPMVVNPTAPDATVTNQATSSDITAASTPIPADTQSVSQPTTQPTLTKSVNTTLKTKILIK